jgi:soluble lytic murein transglycosylase-like protein
MHPEQTVGFFTRFSFYLQIGEYLPDSILAAVGGKMNKGPSLVIRGTFLGIIIVGLMGWILAGQIELQPSTEVAYAAVQAQDIEQPVPEDGECLVSHKFPEEILQWCDMISTLANQTQLSPNLIAAVILQESGGDALAYSASGAVGLMQVMPRDGIAAGFECINGPCFASRPTIEELQDPQFNVEFGTSFLRSLIDSLGSEREALKAYGPMNVDYYYADKVLSIYENYR